MLLKQLFSCMTVQLQRQWSQGTVLNTMMVYHVHNAHAIGRAIFFFAAGLLFFGSWFYAYCFSASLLFCLSAVCFPSFCFSCFSAFHASLLLCFPCFFFSASLLSLLLCFSAFVLLCLSTSTILPFSFLQSCVLLLYFLLHRFSASCLYYLFVFFFSFALFSPVCVLNQTLKTLGETQRNLKEILISTPDKKPLHEAINEPTLKKP